MGFAQRNPMNRLAVAAFVRHGGATHSGLRDWWRYGEFQGYREERVYSYVERVVGDAEEEQAHP